MRIAVIGTGHVGLVTCATLAELGHHVIGVDSDLKKIATLQSRRSPFYEPGLEDLIQSHQDSGRLAFSSEISCAVPDAKVIFICVGTPARASGEANLAAIEAAGREIASHVTGPVVVVEKSTVPAGTAARLRRVLLREHSEREYEVEVVSNPEFLREGHAVQDSLYPDRILIGAESDVAFKSMRDVYRVLLDQGSILIETDIVTAELAKHACNAFLALKISYTNALARLCERAGADVTAVADVMGADSRIGRAFLNAGLGFGGYCLPKDLQAFEKLASQLGYNFPLLTEVDRINTECIETTIAKVKDALWNLDGKTVALLGLSFKPGTDDTRFSPALSLAQHLLNEGVRLSAYDPQVGPEGISEVPEITLKSEAYDAVEGADCAILCTEWQEFKSLDLVKLGERMAYPVLIDARNLFDPDEVREAGFDYYPVGRPSLRR